MESKIQLKVIKNPYLIVSWNVCNYTINIHNWLLEFVNKYNPDVLFLSETKKKEDDLNNYMAHFTDYNVVINPHEPYRWHGVVMLINKKHSFENLDIRMNIAPRKDCKGSEASIGRIIAIHLNKHLYIIGSYTPNSGQSDQVKHSYRVNVWDPAFFNLLEILRKNGPTIWIGDINVALNDIDVSNPKTMKNTAGFTIQERNNFKSILDSGNWIDIWRYQHHDDLSYTWRGFSGRKNYGMRLDNIVISHNLINKIYNTFMIDSAPMFSDHIPICASVNSDF